MVETLLIQTKGRWMPSNSRRIPGLLLRGVFCAGALADSLAVNDLVDMPDCTTHYSAPEIGALIEAAERVCQLESLASPAISVVRSRA